MKNLRNTLLLCAVTSLGSVAVAQEAKVLQFRSVEDASVTADPTVCASAPFPVNLRLAASLWSTRTRASDGTVVNDDVRRIGTATACGQITSFAFPPGLQQNFYVKFELADGSYTASGTCTLESNNVPTAGVVLAGCALKLISAPAGTLGGAATSNSVLNPFKKPGFNTGSYWTLLVYEPGEAHGTPMAAGGFELYDDQRTPEQLDQAATAAKEK